jgi:hypothetical protein
MMGPFFSNCQAALLTAVELILTLLVARCENDIVKDLMVKLERGTRKQHAIKRKIGFMEITFNMNRDDPECGWNAAHLV